MHSPECLTLVCVDDKTRRDTSSFSGGFEPIISVEYRVRFQFPLEYAHEVSLLRYENEPIQWNRDGVSFLWICSDVSSKWTPDPQDETKEILVGFAEGILVSTAAFGPVLTMEITTDEG